MSQRGSFVTEYIYCDKCFQAAKVVLLARDKGLCSTVIQAWAPGDTELPIIAGKLGHSWSEAHAIEHEIGPELAAVICHPVRIAVLQEVGPNDDPAARTIVVAPRPALTLQEIANTVAQFLPVGYTLSLRIERGSARVEVTDPREVPVPLPDTADKSLYQQINDGLCRACGWPA